MAIQLKKLMGWKKWRFLRTFYNGINFPSAAFPKSYLPSRGFMVNAPISHCQLVPPWSTWNGILGQVMAGGGLTGNLTGVLSGISVASILASEPNAAIWGIGQQGPPIQLGYNIGDLFKEHVYIYLKVIRQSSDIGTILSSSYSADVVQRSRLKRMYIKHGEIARFQKIGSQKIISLGIEGNFPSGIQVPPSQIKIKKSNGQELTYPISEVRSNWDIVIDQSDSEEETSTTNPTEQEPSAGDFFILDKAWAIEDPMLMSGYWLGQESDGAMTQSSNSGNPPTVSTENAYVTSHNVPFESGIEFTGAYVWKKIVPPTEEGEEQNGQENEDAQEVEPAGTVIPSAGVSMDDSNGYEWVWVPFANNKAGVEVFDSVYSSTKRYKLAEEIVDEETGAVGYAVKERTVGSMEDVTSLLNAKPSFLRLEISKGGRSFRHNWEPPCLKYSHIKKGNDYFRILAQPESYTIDVSITAAFGSTQSGSTTQTNQQNVAGLTLDGNFEIFNQYAWMISEHFQNDNIDGMFGGQCNCENGKAYITIKSESSGTVNKNTAKSFTYLRVNSFYERFRTDYNGGTSGPKKMWKKFNGWKIINGSSQYAIDSSLPVTIENNYVSDTNSDSKYPYLLSASIFDTGATFTSEKVYISFDNIFTNIGGNSSRGALLLEVKEGIDSSNNPVICLDGSWFSPQVKVDVPFDTSVGVCEGYMFGVGAFSGQVLSHIGATLLISVPNITNGVSSFFHMIRDEDCVFYRDIKSNKLTIRRGTLDFREMPRKQEISIGKVVATEESGGSSSIEFNKEYQRVKMIQMDVPDASDAELDSGAALIFGLGSENEYYGFYISGKGTMDFQALRRFGYAPGEVDIELYKNSGYFISPIYMYMRADEVNKLKTQVLDIGVGTDEGPLYPINGEISSAKISYVDERQTMEDIGLYDAMRVSDGEMIIVYSARVGQFSAGSKGNNGKDGSVVWDNNSCVFIVGSSDDGFSWNCPLIDVNKVGESSNDYQYPLMILNCVDYYSSIYDERSNKLRILLRGYTKDDVPFLGYYVINIATLAKDLVFCTSSQSLVTPNQSTSGQSTDGTLSDNTLPLPFWYRPPTIPYLSNNDYNFTEDTNKVNIDSSNSNTADQSGMDRFVRIAGSPQTKAQIPYNGDLGVPSLISLSDGSLIVLFDGTEGIRMIFSSNSGTTWKISRAVLARDAHAPTFIAGEYLAYITPSGIEVKAIGEKGLYRAMGMVSGDGGFSASEIEIEQKAIDVLPTYLVGSGIIDTQRLSGYKTKQGKIKIFYYDSEGLLCCIESDDGRRWNIANNF